MERFLRFPDLAAFGITFSRMHIDRLEKAGRFPRRVHLGGNTVAWLESEVGAWQQSKIAARAGEPEAA